MIWLDPRIDDDHFVELVETAGGTIVRDTPGGVYAAVSDDWRGLPHIVHLEAQGLPVHGGAVTHLQLLDLHVRLLGHHGERLL